MTQDTTSYIEMLRKFGSDLGLPKLDVDKLIEAKKKNIDALSESARVAGQVRLTPPRAIPERGFGTERELLAEAAENKAKAAPFIQGRNRWQACKQR